MIKKVHHGEINRIGLHLLCSIKLLDYQVLLSDLKISGEITTLHSLRAAPANHQ